MPAAAATYSDYLSEVRAVPDDARFVTGLVRGLMLSACLWPLVIVAVIDVASVLL